MCSMACRLKMAAIGFLSGFDLGWYPINANLDVRRNLTDVVLNDVILRPEEDRPSMTDLYLVKAEAGAGKSVFLRDWLGKHLGTPT